jgi:tetratricopeptide (TPR) repeat protein/predicted Ser/Thr protein kinase
MIGKVVSHYKILTKLGEGGMGVVYKAEDLTLTRPVALKFLPHGLETHEPERERFLQEARAAAILNHPNICTIYEIAEAESQQFIAMEYVDGVTLRERIAEGKLRTGTAVGYAIQIGEALEEAHTKGVVHRDIKAENIMVNAKNQVKVMDFGLAKLKGAVQLTKTSSTVGTLAYMAPEQIEGKQVDARSDIFSFGVVLYEMLTGHLPFRGEHEAAMMYSIMNEEPEPLQTSLPDAPSELLHTVNRALEKDPEQRYQTVHDMLIDLRRLQRESARVVRPSAAMMRGETTTETGPAGLHRLSGMTRWVIVGTVLILAGIVGWMMFSPGEGTTKTGEGGGERSIAVMYFENRSGEKDLDRVLVDMLITNLGRNKQISVVSGQRLYDILKSLGKEDAATVDKSTATEAAKRAGVKTMLLGNIWNVGGKLNVTGQLLDVESGAVINSDRVEASKADEVFAIADRLTEKVGGWLAGSPGEALRIADATTESYDAYRFYEQGMRHIYRFEHADAWESFMEAIRLDSTFAMAHFRLSLSMGLGTTANLLPGTNLALARDHASKAQQYSGNLAMKEKGLIDVWDASLRRNYNTSEELLNALVRRHPDDKDVLWISALRSLLKGMDEKAAQTFEKAIEIDRSYSDAYNMLGYAYCATGQYEKAIATIRTYMALIPDTWNAYDSGWEIHTMAGKFDEALKIAEEGLKRVPDWYGSYYRQGETYLLMDEPGKAREKFAHVAEVDPSSRELTDRYTAMSFAFEGRSKEALDVLRRQVERVGGGGQRETERTARFYTARLLLEQNRVEDALRELEAVKVISREIRTDPSNPWPLVCDYYSGLCLVRKGDYVEAASRAKAIREAIEITIKDPHFMLYCDGLAAEILAGQGKTREALASLEQVIPMGRKRFPRMRMLDARIAITLGDKQRALQLYEGARNRTDLSNVSTMGDFLGFWIEQSKIDYYQAKAYEHFGDRTEAISFYRKAMHHWRNADKDYPPYIDAKERLASLAK